MKKLLFLIISFFLFSCKSQDAIRLTSEELANNKGITTAPLDTLAAYRKMPGEPKTVYVQGYYRKDSSYVKPYYRTKPSKTNN